MDVADDELAVIEASKSDESKFFFCLFFSSFRDVGHLVNAQSHFPSQTQFSLYICPRSSFFSFQHQQYRMAAGGHLAAITGGGSESKMMHMEEELET